MQSNHNILKLSHWGCNIHQDSKAHSSQSSRPFSQSSWHGNLHAWWPGQIPLIHIKRRSSLREESAPNLKWYPPLEFRVGKRVRSTPCQKKEFNKHSQSDSSSSACKAYCIWNSLDNPSWYSIERSFPLHTCHNASSPWSHISSSCPNTFEYQHAGTHHVGTPPTWNTSISLLHILSRYTCMIVHGHKAMWPQPLGHSLDGALPCGMVDGMRAHNPSVRCKHDGTAAPLPDPLPDGAGKSVEAWDPNSFAPSRRPAPECSQWENVK